MLICVGQKRVVLLWLFDAEYVSKLDAAIVIKDNSRGLVVVEAQMSVNTMEKKLISQFGRAEIRQMMLISMTDTDRYD